MELTDAERQVLERLAAGEALENELPIPGGDKGRQLLLDSLRDAGLIDKATLRRTAEGHLWLCRIADNGHQVIEDEFRSN
jgi:hypothetical protein